jgi:hypothetical protein
MNINDNNNDDKAFLLQLHMRTQQKSAEYAELLRERQRLEMRIERAKSYVEQLNNFLKAEGQEPVTVKTTLRQGNSVGKPGNRAKDFPLRSVQWEGIGINEIIGKILNKAPSVSFHNTDVAKQIYEIQSKADLNRVMHNVRSALQKGAREGLWQRADRGKYKAKVIERQGELVRT